MANFPSDHMTARFERDAWMHDNERGLALATDGDWAEASEAFAAAADSLARTLPSDPRGTHEPLALVLSNLAQAYFRSGRLDDAMQQAQRACALRVAIAGEDGMPVARMRMDLAVMLASAGRLDEATMLVQRSISSIEHRVGEEDARLAIVLENAARIALAAGQPANAEPVLIRLHALLDAHELSTSRAEELLSRVAAVRASQYAAATQRAEELTAAQMAASAEAQPAAEALLTEELPLALAAEFVASEAIAETEIEVHAETPVTLSAFDDDTAARIYAHATIAEHEDWEDQPLRDAVAVTEVLLRTTPSGVPIIPAPPALEPPNLEADATALGEADTLLDTMDLTDVLPAPSLREPEPEQMLSLEPTPPAGVDFDLDLAFDEAVTSDAASLGDLEMVEFEPAVAAAPPVAESTPPAVLPPSVGNLTLDFAVEHGMLDDQALIQGPPISSPVPDALELAPVEPPAPTVVPVTQIVSAGSTRGIAPIADMVQTAPVMDAPNAAAASTPSPAAPKSSGATSPADARPTRPTAEDRAVVPQQDASGGKGKLIAIIAGVVVIGGGAAAFFLMR